MWTVIYRQKKNQAMYQKYSIELCLVVTLHFQMRNFVCFSWSARCVFYESVFEESTLNAIGHCIVRYGNFIEIEDPIIVNIAIVEWKF